MPRTISASQRNVEIWANWTFISPNGSCFEIYIGPSSDMQSTHLGPIYVFVLNWLASKSTQSKCFLFFCISILINIDFWVKGSPVKVIVRWFPSDTTLIEKLRKEQENGWLGMSQPIQLQSLARVVLSDKSIWVNEEGLFILIMKIYHFHEKKRTQWDVNWEFSAYQWFYHKTLFVWRCGRYESSKWESIIFFPLEFVKWSQSQQVERLNRFKSDFIWMNLKEIVLRRTSPTWLWEDYRIELSGHREFLNYFSVD